MEYQEFVQTVRDAIQVAAGDDARIVMGKLMKNNNIIEIISVYIGKSNVSPAIHMDWLYQRYLGGYSIEDTISSLLDSFAQHKPTKYDFTFFMKYDLVKDRVTFRLLNYSTNMEMMESVPHRRILDLAVVYYYLLEDESFGKNPSVLIRNSHLDIWGIGMDVLDNDAMQNTIRLSPYEFKHVTEILDDMIPGIDCSNEDIELFVLSNTDHYFGASALLYPGILKEIRRKLGRDYYIIPCSVHECMVAPYTEELDPECLRHMVYEVNTDGISREEILGYSVYFYNDKEDRLEIAAEGIYPGGTQQEV